MIRRRVQLPPWRCWPSHSRPVAVYGQTAGHKPFEPQVGQPGKDVVWVPTPQALVDEMLDMAKVTKRLRDGPRLRRRPHRDHGRQARRARDGIEYNPDMVDLSKRNAEAAGVTGAPRS